MHNKNTIHELIREFYSYAKENMGFDKPCKVFLRESSENAANPLGKSAYYDPEAMEVHLYITDRHPKDILRSFSHELMHHTQKCRGDLENTAATTEGYAQQDEHLRNLELEAYRAAIHLRDWCDNRQGVAKHRANSGRPTSFLPSDDANEAQQKMSPNWYGPAGERGCGKGNRGKKGGYAE